jgi:uncharacterized protein (TIGR02301 family)
VTTLRLALILALSVAIAAPALSQQRPQGGARPATPTAKPAEPAPPPPAPDVPPPPYEKELLRLAEILGSLAFLRGLCTAADAPEWPRRMQTLVDAEGVTPARKERLAGAYNRGYRAFALTYRMCTPPPTRPRPATSRKAKPSRAPSRVDTADKRGSSPQNAARL